MAFGSSTAEVRKKTNQNVSKILLSAFGDIQSGFVNDLEKLSRELPRGWLQKRLPRGWLQKRCF